MKTQPFSSYLLGTCLVLLLSASATHTDAAMTGRGVLVDGSGITTEKIAALQVLLQSVERQAPQAYGEIEVAATPIGKPEIPVAICYDEGTPEERMAQLEAERGSANELDFNPQGASWSSPLGTPVHLRVSLIPDDTFIPTSNCSSVGGNSVLFRRMDALLAAAARAERYAWSRAL